MDAQSLFLLAVLCPDTGKDVKQLVQRLLDPNYLYAIDPGPLGPWPIIYIAWAALLLAIFFAALWWHRRNRVAPAKLTAGMCLLGLFFLGLRFSTPYASAIPSFMRFMLFDVWTARVWPISVTLAALGIPFFWHLSIRHWSPLPQRLIDTLSGLLRPDYPQLLPWQTILLGIVHLTGLSWLWHIAHFPWWWSIPSLIVLSILPILARPHRLRLETLTPLLFSYGSALAYFLFSERLGIDIDAYQGFRLPDPWSPWFNVVVMTLVGIGYTLWIQCRLILPSRFGKVLPIVILAITLVWLLCTVAIHHTYGVTASDPYCYVQMAIDLAETGSPLHAFPLAKLAKELGLPTWPTVHIGYHPPLADNRAPTMWSLGWPVLMVPFYWLGGLELLYFVAPLMALLALLACWFLVNEILHDVEQYTRWTVAALTCFMVATSPENVERVLVPMADAAAQLFTLLTLWLLLRARHARSLLFMFLAGASFGMLYFIRHPQLPLGAAAIVFLLVLNRPLKHKLGLMLAFGLGALLLAIPDLCYHQRVFGHWLKSESTEWFLLSINNIGHSFWSLLESGILRREELGFVMPLVIVGCVVLWNTHRQITFILASGLGAVFGFHLCYAALRPRDLIAIFPLFYLCAAYGLVTVWNRLQQSPRYPRIVGLVCCLLLFFARSSRSLELPWQDDTITFGYVNQAQLQALRSINDLLPKDAVIASMLNGGAVELYSGRQAVHPAAWTKEELLHWGYGLEARKLPFYVLDDGEEMAAVLTYLGADFRLVLVTSLDVPYFAVGGGNLPRQADLYLVHSLP